MRPTARLLTGTALAAVSTGLTSLCAATTAAAATSTSATAITTTTAIAADDGRLELSPKVVRPGSLVSVSTTVCREGPAKGEARSAGAGEFRLERAAGRAEDQEADQETLVGRFRVPHEIGRGPYRVGVRCEDGRRITREFFVERDREPRGPVRSGIGGSVGPDTTQIAVGAAVVAAAAVGGTLRLRRRASGAQER
ncbi:hypothetical protein ACFV0C_16280 [Streptomyces sp. NPDC059568]|uniref:hypothetical protein n=1 Tax=Streptomyces sp. NPDC059568 TaxID=3346868 RepID=UPI0036BA5DA2